VLYVDSDPIVLAHARAHVGGNKSASVVEADITDPTRCCSTAKSLALPRLDQAIAIVCTATLHYYSTDSAGAVMKTYLDAAASGSCTVVSHSSTLKTTAPAPFDGSRSNSTH